jgi:orotidine-5'-phosphate decarboxylase
MTPIPIIALDFARAEDAIALVDELSAAPFFKVGLQLYTAAGPDIVRQIRGRGHRVFLDLKLHDIPNTVAGAVSAAAALDVDLLTVHASGGSTMLRAAADAAASSGHAIRIFAVTVLTSLRDDELGQVWGRNGVTAAAEAVRLARLADQAGVDGVVASVHEVVAIRDATRSDFPVLTPGIRLPGDAAGDQARVASPADAARAGASFIVVGRSVTAADVPAAAFERILESLAEPPPPVTR